MKRYIKMGILMCCVCVASLFICNGISNSNTNSSKIIKHELRLMKDGGGDYIIKSMPQELSDSEEFNTRCKTGALSVIFTLREDGKWDTEPLIASRFPYNHPLIKRALNRLHLFMYICNKAIPDEKKIAIGYYADYDEVIIYLHPDLWKNKAHYEEVIKKLNKAIGIIDITGSDDIKII